jgi:plasmid replication initiation protein
MSKTVDQDGFVVKSNHLVEARYRLSLQESHVILWLLTQIRPDDEDFKIHELKISEFAKMAGLEVDSQYKELRKVTLHLMKRILEIKEINLKNKKTTLQVAWLSSAEYHHGEGYVSLCFDPKLKPYLLQLKTQFTKIGISDAMGFDSVHALRIHELLVQYESIGHRTMSVAEIRDYCGIEKDEYTEYKNLKSRVINRAKTEINAKTDYDVDFTEIKNSRKVDKINWTIGKKKSEEVVTKPKTKKQPGLVPIAYESCVVPEIVVFCKANETVLERDKIDYLLNVNDFNLNNERLQLGFTCDFFRNRCDIAAVTDLLVVFFETKRVDYV